MPDSFTNGKLGLVEPPNGAYVNIWDQPLQSNWKVIEAAVSGTTLNINLSAGNVNLVRPEYSASPPVDPTSVPNSMVNLRLLLTGTLTGDRDVVLESGVPGMWLIDNQTTGSAFTVTVKTSAGGSTGVTPPRGYLSYIFSDGTNVRYADLGNVIANVPQGVPAGSILSFAGVAPPSGYLFCDGSVVSQTTYAALYVAIGTTWNTGGEGAGNFRLPDFQNMFLRGSGTSAVGVYEADAFKSHTHTASVTDPGHIHGLNSQSGFSGGAGQAAQSAIFQGIFNTLSALTGISVTNALTGGTETRPVNKRVLYIIKT